jgi:23S rRNA (cytidine1920-2'-O)/16S rRNA (cytidine1409-2'-O)-methyltransferase
VTGVPRARLDQVLVDRGFAPTRNAARGLIMAGLVEVGGVIVDKAGTPVKADAGIHVKSRPRFVSRAGDKLAHALEVFGLEVAGVRALDVGASTGGFVDCLLQSGADRVIALDVGYGQLDQRLREDPRVQVMERVNARYLEAASLPYAPDFLTVDVSFISLKKVLPAVVAALSPSFDGLLLVKPQFEAGPERVGKGGIVRSAEVRCDVLRDIARALTGPLGLEVMGVTGSGLPGVGGNKEFFFRVGRGRGAGLALDTLERCIELVSEREGSDG